MPGGHHPRRTIQHRTEVIPAAQLGFPGRQPHPHRQLQRPLRGHRRIHRRARRGERGAHAVAGVLEQPTPVPLDRGAQYLVMRGQRHPHRLRVGLPPTGRTLNIGEQKRHNTRSSGHLSRMSQRSLFHLEHHRTTQTTDDGIHEAGPSQSAARQASKSRRQAPQETVFAGGRLRDALQENKIHPMSDWGLSGLRSNPRQSGSAKHAPGRNDAIVVDTETRCDLVCNGGRGMFQRHNGVPYGLAVRLEIVNPVVAQ